MGKGSVLWSNDMKLYNNIDLVKLIALFAIYDTDVASYGLLDILDLTSH